MKFQNKDFKGSLNVIHQIERAFPTDLALLVKVSVSDCLVDGTGYSRF